MASIQLFSSTNGELKNKQTLAIQNGNVTKATCLIFNTIICCTIQTNLLFLVAASWTSGASTLSSIPSSAITPPPPLQHKLSARRKGKTVVHSTAQMSPYTFRSVLEREADLPATKMRKNSSLDTESLTSNCSGENQYIHIMNFFITN